MSRTHCKLLQLLLYVLMLSACGKSNELSWTEDVKLPDGRVITLKRWVEFKGGSSHLGDPSGESKQNFEFKNPETGELVHWQSDTKEGLVKTVALWVEQGTPMLLSSPAYGRDAYKLDCPNPPYLLHKYASGTWYSTPLAQVHIKRIRANLTTHPLEMREEIERSKRHLTVEQTSNSYVAYQGVLKVPYVIQFDGMPAQTFRQEDCSRVSNLKGLIFVEGR